MSVRKNRDSIVCTFAILIVIVAEIIMFSNSVVRADAGQKTGASAKATFQSKCAMCHGPDGAGSEAGKSMNVLDLRSDAVQKLPDAELVKTISDGKGGMPPFKGSLSEAQIHALVRYVRSLRSQKK
jgi:cytochrome c6